ncbi:uncharacterized protein LOC117332331 [Pecten maximus]|uniref:uncharacterized protein LOC117332331 n=1 Tax=Pecten maximus TaxID=6579 RepID=UPI0014581C26|nr:uncharacterized protein LOC117332331 [Pecten maximus]
MGFYPVLNACHSTTAKVVLKSSEPKPKHLGGGYNSLMDWLGDGLLLSEGKKWERNRRLLTPAFHFDVLKPYVGIYNKVFDIFLEKLERATSGGKSVEIYDLVGLATMDTMMRCSVSYQGEIQHEGQQWAMDTILVVIGTLLAAICLKKVFGVIQKYRVNINLYYEKKIQPIGKFHPIWGHLYLFSDFNRLIDVCGEVVAQTKCRIVSYWIMGFYPVLNACHSTTAKMVLKSSEPKPKHLGGGYNSLMDWLGEGLLLSEGKKWERNRRLLTPAFHFDVLKPYVGIYNKVFDIFLEKLERATSGGKSVEIYDLVGLATLDTMMRCSVSYQGEIQHEGPPATKMNIFFVAIGSILAIFCIWKLVAVLRRYKVNIDLYCQKNILPIGKFHPIWGHLNQFSDFDDLIDISFKLVRQTGSRILSHWIMCFFPVISVCHSETAKQILKSSEPKPKQVGGGYFTLKDWIGDGLLMSDGKKWERNRRLLTPAFHFDVLKPYVGVFNNVCDTFLENAERATSCGRSVEMYGLVGLATLDSILRCSVSYYGKIQEQGLKHPYANAVQRLTLLSQERLMSPLLWFTLPFYLSPSGREFARLSKYVHEFDENIINERRKLLAADPSILKKRRLDFLDIMLTAKDEKGTGLTDREIRDEVDTFIFEGQETPNSAVSWAIYALAKYPEEQQKVYEEVRRVLGDRQTVEWNDIKEFNRLSLFIKETLRMFPPVPFIVRCTTNEMEIDGVTIPTNTEINVMIYVMNHLADVWDQPMEFRPDRFAGESDRDPYSYVPFAAGPRNCIGQHFALSEVKVMLARLVQRLVYNFITQLQYQASTSLKYSKFLALGDEGHKTHIVKDHCHCSEEPQYRECLRLLTHFLQNALTPSNVGHLSLATTHWHGIAAQTKMVCTHKTPCVKIGSLIRFLTFGSLKLTVNSIS